MTDNLRLGLVPSTQSPPGCPFSGSAADQRVNTANPALPHSDTGEFPASSSRLSLRITAPSTMRAMAAAFAAWWYPSYEVAEMRPGEGQGVQVQEQRSTTLIHMIVMFEVEDADSFGVFFRLSSPACLWSRSQKSNRRTSGYILEESDNIQAPMHTYR